MKETLRTTEEKRIHKLRLKRHGGEEGLKKFLAFGDAYAQAMVDNLNRKVKEEKPD